MLNTNIRSIDVQIEHMETADDIPILEYAKPGDSGFDLRASKEQAVYKIGPNRVELVPTGIKFAVPEGFELQIRTRSGSALKQGFFVANSPGTVDSGYRGEVKVVVYNFTEKPIIIEAGDRIAQGVICPVIKANFVWVPELDETERGAGGFGSTGIK